VKDFIHNIDGITNLITVGATTASTIIGLIRAGRVQVQNAQGQLLTAEDVVAHWNTLIAAAIAAGDETTARLLARHAGEDDGA